MIITILITIVAVILFILFLSIILAGIADDNATILFHPCEYSILFP